MKHFFLKSVTIALFLNGFFFSLVFSLPGLEEEIDLLSGKTAKKIGSVGKKKIAVVDFTDLDGNVTELGRFLAEEFSASFSITGKGFIVFDRIHLKKIMKEHKLSSTGLVDPKNSRQLGKLMGVDALVTGTLTPLGEKVRVIVKILDVQTAP